MAATVPGRHGAHVSLLPAPRVALAVPAGQDSHAAFESEPVVGLKLPAGQGSQTMRVAAPASSQYPPRGQGSQSARPMSGEKLPAGQVRQSDWPVRGWYWPGAHGMQLSLLGAPRAGIREPIGQGSGSTVPSSQKWPLMHWPLQDGWVRPLAAP